MSSQPAYNATNPMQDPVQLMDQSLDGMVSGMAITETEIQALTVEKPTMPQLDFDTYPSQIFWLVITFTALYLLIAKSALPRIHEIMDKRRHRIERDLDRAEALSREAQDAKEHYDALERKTRTQSASIIAIAQQEMEAQSTAHHASTDEKITALMQHAEQDRAAKRQALQDSLRDTTHALVSRVVTEITGTAPDATLIKNNITS